MIKKIKIIVNNIDFLLNYYISWGIRILYYKITGFKLRNKYYAQKVVLKSFQANNILRKILENNKEPFMVGRYGSIELRFMTSVVLKRIFHRIKIKNIESLQTHSGFFPLNLESIGKFTDLMIDSTKECDLMCVWYNRMEDYFCKNNLKKKTILSHRGLLDFWNFDIPFTYGLRGKKVLVVSLFADTIKKQYEKRDKLFKNEYVLPEFDLVVVKAVETRSGNSGFFSWFDALDYMYKQCIKEDFDIAIISCGAYGFPLAAKLKKIGKITIHMGGVTQVLFGIKGKRWDDHPDASKLYNEYWVRPDESEKPPNFKKIENGCYW